MAPSVAEDWELPLSLDLDDAEITDAPPSSLRKDRDCERCERPRSVCLCATLPAAPLQLAGRVIILQHPHEHKKRLATVPVLQKCVAPGCVAVLRGRTYRLGHPAHAALQAALAGAAEGRHPLLVLFPGAGARDVREVGAELRAAAGAAAAAAEAAVPSGAQQLGGQPGGQPQAEGGSAAQRSEQSGGSSLQGSAQGSQRHTPQGTAQYGQPRGPPAQRQRCGRHDDGQPLYVLFVIDGTWKQAKEMLKAAAPHVLSPSGPGLRVQLPPAAAQEPTQRDAAARPGDQEQSTGQQQQQEQQQPIGQLQQQQQQEEQQPTRQQQQQQQEEQQQAEQRQQQSTGQQRQEAQQQEEQRQAASGPPSCAAGAAGDCSQQAAAAVSAAAGGLGCPLLIRMEPLEGCVTTCEAVARALGALEPAGEAVEAAILRPLAQLALFQAQFDPSTAARLAESSVGYSQARRHMGLTMQRDLTQIR